MDQNQQPYQEPRTNDLAFDGSNNPAETDLEMSESNPVAEIMDRLQGKKPAEILSMFQNGDISMNEILQVYSHLIRLEKSNLLQGENILMKRNIDIFSSFVEKDHTIDLQAALHDKTPTPLAPNERVVADKTLKLDFKVDQDVTGVDNRLSITPSDKLDLNTVITTANKAENPELYYRALGKALDLIKDKGAEEIAEMVRDKRLTTSYLTTLLMELTNNPDELEEWFSYTTPKGVRGKLYTGGDLHIRLSKAIDILWPAAAIKD